MLAISNTFVGAAVFPDAPGYDPFRDFTAIACTVATGSLVEARCELIRKTGSLAFMSARLMVADEVLASATGVWKFR